MSGGPSNALRLALAAFLALSLASAALGQELVVSGRVVAITDGDTVKALTADNQLLRIRLSWIDAPGAFPSLRPPVQATLERARIGARGRAAHSRIGSLLSGTGDRVFLALSMVFLGWRLH
jgi:endonuclease YncB( thermonuclease family)